MNGDMICTRLGPLHTFWLHNHQMYVQRLFGNWANRFNDQRTNRIWGQTVHDINVNPVCTSRITAQFLLPDG